MGLAVAAGVLDVTANVTFLLATQEGLSIVAVIAAVSGGHGGAGHRRHP